MPELRRISQIFWWLFFVALLLKTRYPLDLPLPLNLFPRLSPFLAISTFIATRKFLFTFLPAGIISLLTIFLGRFFCGWICPLGTSIDASDFFLTKTGLQFSRRIRIRNFKYYLLIFVLAGALVGGQLAGWWDPLSLVTRSYVTTFLSYSQSFTRYILRWLRQVPLLNNLYFPLNQFLKKEFFPVHYPLFSYHLLFLGIILILLLLSLIEKRFWCRNLCPLGTVLAFLSRFSIFKRQVSSACIQCQKCLKNCRMGAISGKGESNLGGECILCLDCKKICPSQAITFGPSATTVPVNISRRNFLISAAGGLLMLGLLKNIPPSHPDLLRPPGILPEPEFLEQCIRCGECLKVCPTRGLQFSWLEGGILSLWTPKLVPRIGYCEYYCHLCSSMCPSGAIKKMPLEEKQKIKIGTAFIDRQRCLPWAKNQSCIVCEEVCPIPTKAIKVKKTLLPQSHRELLRPYVLPEDCIGCGTCENRCPLPGEAAIQIIPVSQKSGYFAGRGWRRISY